MLTGVIGRGKKGSVLINNEVVPVGESVQDVRVVSIERQGAYFEYQGQTKFVHVGATTAQ